MSGREGFTYIPDESRFISNPVDQPPIPANYDGANNPGSAWAVHSHTTSYMEHLSHPYSQPPPPLTHMVLNAMIIKTIPSPNNLHPQKPSVLLKVKEKKLKKQQ